MTNQSDADKLAAIERSDGYKTMMSTPQARRVMWERFEVMALYQVSQTLDPSALAFKEGQRSVGLQVMQDLLVYVPDLYDRMVVENRQRLREEQANQPESDQ